MQLRSCTTSRPTFLKSRSMAKKTDFQKTFDKILGEHVRLLRDHLKLSQLEMAKKMGVQRQQYDKLEKGLCSTILYTVQGMFNTAGLDFPSLLAAANTQFLSETMPLRKKAELNDARKYYDKELKRRNKDISKVVLKKKGKS